MGFYHFIKAMALPPANFCLAFVIGLLLILRWRRLGLGVLWATTIVFYLLAAPLTANKLAWCVASVPPLSPAADLSGAQAIVVLSAGAFIGGREYADEHSPIVIDGTTEQRLRYAAHLYHRTPLPVLVSGGVIQGLPTALADAMKLALEHDFAVPVTWTERQSRDTADNAAMSAAILKAAGIGSIILVTDATHMPRALRLFEATGLTVLPAPTGFPPTVSFLPADLVPRMAALDQSEFAIYEILGRLWYGLF